MLQKVSKPAVSNASKAQPLKKSEESESESESEESDSDDEVVEYYLLLVYIIFVQLI